MHEEASGLLARAQKLLPTLAGAERLKLEKAIHLLNNAMSGDDIDQLQEALDRVTDLMIDLEFKE
jgi:hypothetical protein